MRFRNGSSLGLGWRLGFEGIARALGWILGRGIPGKCCKNYYGVGRASILKILSSVYHEDGSQHFDLRVSANPFKPSHDC
jgi:hypothetical protein